MSEKVVVGVDGSPGSEPALRWVVSRAAASDTEVVAVHAIRPLGEFMLDLPDAIGRDSLRPSDPDAMTRAYARSELDAAARREP